MLVGYLGMGAFIGAVAALYSLTAGGSFLVALGIYSMSGALLVLVLAAASFLKSEMGDPSNDSFAATPAE